MGIPASKQGLDVYKHLHILHNVADHWFVRVVLPNLSMQVWQLHAALDELRMSLDRNLPTRDECERAGIPPIKALGGGQK